MGWTRCAVLAALALGCGRAEGESKPPAQTSGSETPQAEAPEADEAPQTVEREPTAELPELALEASRGVEEGLGVFGLGGALVV